MGKVNKPKLETADIHVLVCILLGTVPGTGVPAKLMRLKTAGGVNLTVIKFLGEERADSHLISTASIKVLSDAGLIYLKPTHRSNKNLPPRLYEGEWGVRKSVLKAHPQYKEIRIQAALGV